MDSFRLPIELDKATDFGYSLWRVAMGAYVPWRSGGASIPGFRVTRHICDTVGISIIAYSGNNKGFTDAESSCSGEWTSYVWLAAKFGGDLTARVRQDLPLLLHQTNVQ